MIRRFLFLFILFLLVPFSVHASGSATNNINFNATGWAYNSISFTTPANQQHHGIDFLGVTYNQGVYRLAMDFSNTINSDFITFYVWDGAAQICSFNYSSNSMPICNQQVFTPPMVLLNRNACTVTPIGAGTNGSIDNSVQYGYSGLSMAVCPSYLKSGNQSIEVYTTPFSHSEYFIGISSKFNSFKDNVSLDDVQESINGVQDKVNDLNDNITSKDTTESQTQANSFFDNFQTDTYGLSDIITMPLTLIKSLTNSTCVSLDLSVPFVDKTLSLPCMSSIYSKYFGSFFTLYQLVTFGFVAYWVSVRIFNLVKDFKNPDHDEIEVLDL